MGLKLAQGPAHVLELQVETIGVDDLDVKTGLAQGSGAFAKTIPATWSSYIVLGTWILFALVFAITSLVAYLTYANYLFVLDDDALKIKRGFLSKDSFGIEMRNIKSGVRIL